MSPEHLFHVYQHAPASKSSERLRSVGMVFLFLTSLFVTAIVGRMTILKDVNFSAGEVLSDKQAVLQTSTDEFDVFFVGTSHIYRGISPQVFDRTCQEHGAAVRSYNAGVFRLGILEADTLVNTIIENRDLDRPWFIVMEPSLRDCDFTNWTSERELFNHDSQMTQAAVNLHWHGLQEKQSIFLMVRHAAAMAGHLGSGIVNLLNYGLASRIAFPDSQRFAKTTYTPPGADGFVPLDIETARYQNGIAPPTSVSSAVFLKLLETGTLQREKISRPPMSSGILFYENLIQKVEAAGGRILFVATPRITPGAPLSGDDIEALFNHPPPAIAKRMLGDYRYAGVKSGVFQSENWFDPEHLNRQGAEKFSATLAVDFVARMRSAIPAHSTNSSETP